MARLAFQHSYRFSQNHSPSWAFLVQLSGAHDKLVAEMDNLDRITLGLQFDVADVTAGRWRISQASLSRRSLASRLFEFLLDRVDKADLAHVKEVQLADQEMMRRSATHVRLWTMQTISTDWSGYCRASRDIRMHMKAHILLEKQILYPLLERLAGTVSSNRLQDNPPDE